MKKSEIVKLATLIAKIDDRETMNNVISLIKDQQKIVRASATLVAKAALTVGAIPKRRKADRRIEKRRRISRNPYLTCLN